MEVSIERGQVWNTMVPFNDQQSAKRRPAVIVGWSGFAARDDHNILIVPAFTFDGDPTKGLAGDIPLSNPKAAGLSEKSRVRCHRLMSLHPKSFDFGAGKPLGTLVSADLELILTEIEKLLAVPQWVTVRT